MNTSCKVCLGSLFICLVLVSIVTSVKVSSDASTDGPVTSSSGSKETRRYRKYKPSVTYSHSQNVVSEPPTSIRMPGVVEEPSEPVSIAEASTELKRVITTETCKVRKNQRTFRWNLDECQTTSSLSRKRRRKIVPDEETRRNILDLYSGVFFTQESALELETARQKTQARSGDRVQRSTEGKDGNICCPSVSVLEAAPSQMVNSYLETRDLVHFHSEGIYQYINKGYCVSLSEQSCSGICVPETRIIYLLVWKDPLPTNNDSLPFTFEPFDIPSFCSCKNITP